MQTKHTPAPWWKDKHSDNNDVIVRDTNGTIVANLSVDYSESWIGQREGNETEANAKLISAAPELLSICLKILEDDVQNGILKGVDRSKLKKAIAKATL